MSSCSLLFVTQNRKLVISSPRMCDFTCGKNSVNKVCFSILNCRPGNKYKTEGFWSVFKSFGYSVFHKFSKKNWWCGETRKQPTSETRTSYLSEVESTQLLASRLVFFHSNLEHCHEDTNFGIMRLGFKSDSCQFKI